MKLGLVSSVTTRRLYIHPLKYIYVNVNKLHDTIPNEAHDIVIGMKK
jgi:hypothetical protein